MFILRWIRKFIVIVVTFALGLLIGAYAVTKVRPRHFISVQNCTVNCISPKELLGLVGSIGIQYGTDFIPGVVMETDKTVVIKYPKPVTKYHYVIIPKKDIKNIAELEDGDQAYIQDAVNVIGELVRKDDLHNYKVVTNGPGYQSVSYLHFHLTAN